MGIVVGERGHEVRGDARVVRGKAARHRRVAVERQPVERVAVQVEHPQAIRRHGLFAREPHGVLLRQPLKRHEQTHRASFLVISRADRAKAAQVRAASNPARSLPIIVAKTAFEKMSSRRTRTKRRRSRNAWRPSPACREPLRRCEIRLESARRLPRASRGLDVNRLP